MNQPTSPATSIQSAVIFIVDDEEVICDAMQSQLREAGFTEVYGFHSVIDVIHALKSNRPEVIVTDIHMPDANGRFLSQFIKSDQETMEIPMIAVTGDADPKTNEIMAMYGVPTVLQKPIEAQILADCVTSAIIKARGSMAVAASPSSEDQQQKSETSAKIMNQETELRELFGRRGGVEDSCSQA